MKGRRRDRLESERGRRREGRFRSPPLLLLSLSLVFLSSSSSRYDVEINPARVSRLSGSSSSSHVLRQKENKSCRHGSDCDDDEEGDAVLAFLSEGGGGGGRRSGEASERAAERGKKSPLSGMMGNLARRVKIHCCIDGFSAAGPQPRRNRRDESPESLHSVVGIHPSFLRSIDGPGPGRAAENDRAASFFPCEEKMQHENRFSSKAESEGKRGARRETRNSREVCRVGLNRDSAGKFRPGCARVGDGQRTEHTEITQLESLRFTLPCVRTHTRRKRERGSREKGRED